MTGETRSLAVGLGIVTVAATVAVILLTLPDNESERIVPADTTPATVFTVTNLPPPLTTAAVVVVSTPALRGPQIQLSEPPVPTGVWNLPLAPSTLEGCDEFTYYRIQFGLPARFDQLAYRESRCTNTPISRTGCCVGFLQIHWINFRDHRMIGPLEACGATWENIRGADPLSMQRQLCAAAALYTTVGYTPWSL